MLNSSACCIKLLHSSAAQGADAVHCCMGCFFDELFCVLKGAFGSRRRVQGSPEERVAAIAVLCSLSIALVQTPVKDKLSDRTKMEHIRPAILKKKQDGPGPPRVCFCFCVLILPVCLRGQVWACGAAMPSACVSQRSGKRVSFQSVSASVVDCKIVSNLARPALAGMPSKVPDVHLIAAWLPSI